MKIELRYELPAPFLQCPKQYFHELMTVGTTVIPASHYVTILASADTTGAHWEAKKKKKYPNIQSIKSYYKQMR